MTRPGKKQQKRKPRKQAASRRRSKQTQITVSDWLPSAEVLRSAFVLAFLLLLIVAFLQGYGWMMRPGTLPIRQVSVSGDFNYLQPEVLQKKLATEVSGGFFSLDLEQLQGKLEALPWVHRVALRRDWPDRLHVYFKEQVPIAQWGETFLLNRYGEVFEPESKEVHPTELPQIIGEPGREKALIEDFIRYDRMLNDVDLTLTMLREDARQDQHLLLANGMKLVLGRKGRVKRLARFARIFTQTLSSVSPQIDALDLRYSNGFSVRWHEPDPAEQSGDKDHV